MRKQQSSQFDQGTSSGAWPESGGYPSSYSPHGPEASWRHGQDEWSTRQGHSDAGYGFDAPRRGGDEHRFAHRSYPPPQQQTRNLGAGGPAAENLRQGRPYQAVGSEEWSGGYPRPTPQGGAYGSAGYPGYGGYTGYGANAEASGRRGLGRQGKRPMPKGYKRSDERLREDICERMIASELEIAEVEVEVQNGCVTVSGTVPARWTKHALEDLVEQCTGVTDIDNRLRIQAAAEGDTTGYREPAPGKSPAGDDAAEVGAQGAAGSAVK